MAGAQSANVTRVLREVGELATQVEHLSESLASIRGELTELRSDISELKAGIARLDERTSLLGLIAGGIAVVSSAVSSAIAYLIGRR